MGHVIMENRHGLAVSAALTHATGTAEREATLDMLSRVSRRNKSTLGADKAYDVWRFRKTLKNKHHVISHAAKKRTQGRNGLPTRLPKGYGRSQKVRKRIEEIFGWLKTLAQNSGSKLWLKTIGGLRKAKFKGRARVGFHYNLAVTAYNLIRLPKLL